MNLGEMRQELRSRFGAFIAENRANRLLNEAHADLTERYRWPFMQRLTQGNAPLVLQDLRQILHVVDNDLDRRLRAMEVEELASIDPEFDPGPGASSGKPWAYWVDNGAAGEDATIRTFPATTDAISVYYQFRATDLLGDGSVSEIPPRYHALIVDMAQLRAMLEGPNARMELDAGRVDRLAGLIDSKIERMRAELLNQSERQTYIEPNGEDMAVLY